MGTKLGRRGTPGQIGGWNRKVEQEVDAQTRVDIVKVGARRCVEPQPGDSNFRIVDRARHVTVVVHACGQLKPSLVEHIEQAWKPITWFAYDEIKKGRNLEQNIQLENGDVVLVP